MKIKRAFEKGTAERNAFFPEEKTKVPARTCSLSNKFIVIDGSVPAQATEKESLSDSETQILAVGATPK